MIVVLASDAIPVCKVQVRYIYELVKAGSLRHVDIRILYPSFLFGRRVFGMEWVGIYTSVNPVEGLASGVIVFETLNSSLFRVEAGETKILIH